MRGVGGADAAKKDSESRKRHAEETSTVKQAISETEKEAKRDKAKKKKAKRVESEQLRTQEVKAWTSFAKKKVCICSECKASIIAVPIAVRTALLRHHQQAIN